MGRPASNSRSGIKSDRSKSSTAEKQNLRRSRKTQSPSTNDEAEDLNDNASDSESSESTEASIVSLLDNEDKDSEPDEESRVSPPDSPVKEPVKDKSDAQMQPSPSPPSKSSKQNTDFQWPIIGFDGQAVSEVELFYKNGLPIPLSPGPKEPSHTLYVRNLPTSKGPSTLKRLLLRYFEQFGSIREVCCHRGLVKRGQAWVIFRSEKDATCALQETIRDSVHFCGQPIIVQFSRTTSRIVAKDLGIEDDIRAHSEKRKSERPAEIEERIKRKAQAFARLALAKSRIGIGAPQTVPVAPASQAGGVPTLPEPGSLFIPPVHRMQQSLAAAVPPMASLEGSAIPANAAAAAAGSVVSPSGKLGAPHSALHASRSMHPGEGSARPPQMPPHLPQHLMGEMQFMPGMPPPPSGFGMFGRGGQAPGPGGVGMPPMMMQMPMQRMPPGGPPGRIAIPLMPKPVLFVSNLPAEATEAELTKLFSAFAGFNEVRMVPGRRDIAFVEYTNEIESDAARRALNEQSFPGTETKITVEFRK